ncbi:MAG: TlyA family RNA methyltransferase [Alphaproteobacteria bacterium]|nr:TlyA family RNA methyltransferase [Alphaproteobacteria bacterium]MCZ6763953.1 TlyA family RNA methyltransferase [Alphaproteobacteria bacterium]
MTSKSRVRADTALVAAGLATSRQRAQALIMAGRAYAGGTKIAKAGALIPPDMGLEVRGRDHPFVSRGGVKLAHGLDHFSIDPKGKIALDIGASTGGFTDVLLTLGAARVYAVDVGHGQLDWGLRNDDRVVVLERTNARVLDRSLVPDPVDLIVCDASFIGLATVLPAPMALAAEAAHLVALVKPQFEVGKGKVGKGGVVRDASLREAACEAVCAWLDARPGWRVMGLTPSPITGPKGNVEYLIAARCGI